jgi:Piezo non-specific cation channel, R-Ras-binding domain
MPQIFAAVPFVYELREILDWSATATTLRLYDWLKLEVGWSTSRRTNSHDIANLLCSSLQLRLCAAGHQHVAVLCDSQPEEPRPALPGAARPAVPEARTGAEFPRCLNQMLFGSSWCSPLIRCRCALQGALLFVGLLVLLWVPLLIFSTGEQTLPCYLLPSALPAKGSLQLSLAEFQHITALRS